MDFVLWLKGQGHEKKDLPVDVCVPFGFLFWEKVESKGTYLIIFENVIEIFDFRVIFYILEQILHDVQVYTMRNDQ